MRLALTFRIASSPELHFVEDFGSRAEVRESCASASACKGCLLCVDLSRPVRQYESDRYRRGTSEVEAKRIFDFVTLTIRSDPELYCLYCLSPVILETLDQTKAAAAKLLMPSWMLRESRRVVCSMIRAQRAVMFYILGSPV